MALMISSTADFYDTDRLRDPYDRQHDSIAQGRRERVPATSVSRLDNHE
jgi:hypothetical protein